MEQSFRALLQRNQTTDSKVVLARQEPLCPLHKPEKNALLLSPHLPVSHPSETVSPSSHPPVSLPALRESPGQFFAPAPSSAPSDVAGLQTHRPSSARSQPISRRSAARSISTSGRRKSTLPCRRSRATAH